MADKNRTELLATWGDTPDLLERMLEHTAARCREPRRSLAQRVLARLKADAP